MDKHQLPLSLAALLLEVAKTEGANREILLQCGHFDAQQRERLQTSNVKKPMTAGATLPAEQFYQLREAALQITQQPGLDISFAQALAEQTLTGTLAHALAYSSSLERSLKILCRHYQQIFGHSTIEWQIVGEHTNLNFNATKQGQPAQQQLSREVFFIGALSALRDLTCEDTNKIKLSLIGDPPPYAKAFSDIAPCAIEFNSDYNRICLPASWLNHTVTSDHWGAVQVFTEQLCNQLETELQAPQGSSASMLIELLLRHSQPRLSLEQCAKQLNTSSRQLKRQLQQQDSGYRQLLNHLQASLGKLYLSHPAISVKDAADCLGFHHDANFRRAFMAIFGQSPAQFKKIQASTHRA